MDPPLSALGHCQAAETAKAIARERPTVIFSSPYLRVLQTAQPLAHLLGLPILIEVRYNPHASLSAAWMRCCSPLALVTLSLSLDILRTAIHSQNCLAEFGHTPHKIARPAARVAVIPEVDETYKPVLGRECCGLNVHGKEPTVAYFRRLLLWKRELASGRFDGQTVVCYSHAASVALIGALTDCSSLKEAGRFAPCGIWKLVSDDGGKSWKVERRGDDNTEHCSVNVRRRSAFVHMRSASRCHTFVCSAGHWLACSVPLSSALALGSLPVECMTAIDTFGAWAGIDNIRMGF